MKRIILIGFASLSLSFGLLAGQNDVWEIASSEQQFDNRGEVIYKSAAPQQEDVNSLDNNQTTSKYRQMASAKTLAFRPVAKNASLVFWIYDAWVDFYIDDDRDGYFNHFSVGFDADTAFEEAQVYARLYLGKDEIFKEYHTTSTFTIFGDTSNDSFVVESELLNGFASGDYEVLIELYDEYTNELVAVFDGYNDADLYLLPLESQDYEEVYEEPKVIIVTEHGGSLGWWSLCLFSFLLLRKYRISHF